MLRRLAASRLVRVGFLLLAVGLGIAAVADHWPEVRRAASTLSVPALVAAQLAVLAGLGATMLSWRALLADLGSPLPLRSAARVFFLGQLGKYVPGSVWSVVAQVELAHRLQVPRRRSAAVGALTLVLSLSSGLLVAAVTVPVLSRAAAGRYWPVLAAVPVLLAGLHPRVLNPLISRVLRLAGREPLESPLTVGGIGRAFGWAVLGWVGYGLQVVALAVDLGAPPARGVPLSIGVFALAWSVGFLVVFVPAGVGVREAVLTAGLAPVLPAGAALVLALVSRVLMSIGDLVWAGLAGALHARRTSRSAG